MRYAEKPWGFVLEPLFSESVGFLRDPMKMVFQNTQMGFLYGTSWKTFFGSPKISLFLDCSRNKTPSHYMYEKPMHCASCVWWPADKQRLNLCEWWNLKTQICKIHRLTLKFVHCIYCYLCICIFKKYDQSFEFLTSLPKILCTDWSVCMPVCVRIRMCKSVFTQVC